MEIKWNYFSSLNYNFIVLCELLMPCQLFVQKCSNCQEITKISKCLGSPPNTLSLVIYMYIGIFCYWVVLQTTCHSKQLPVGLTVLSDGMVHFLKIENFLKQIYQNYLVALRESTMVFVIICPSYHHYHGVGLHVCMYTTCIYVHVCKRFHLL